MREVRIVQGRAVPLRRSDVDTDQIIPSDWLKKVERTGFGLGLFSEWRDDPEFVLNLPEFGGANILLAGPNFGTGSSREHAVWAIVDYGFEAVVSPRFADIFRNNCTKNGLVPVQVTPEVSDRLHDAVEENPELEILIDLERLVITAPLIELEAPFPLDPSIRHRFLHGLDDIAITMKHGRAIDAYEAHRPAWLPSVPAPPA